MTHTDEFITAQLIPPDERLTEVIRHVYCVQQAAWAPATVPKQLLPNFEMMLGFNFGPDLPITLGGASYVIRQTVAIGPLQKVLHYNVPPGADFMIVVFSFNGFRRLIGKSMHELEGMNVFDPDLLLAENCFQDLWAQMAALPSVEARTECLTDYIMQNITPIDADTYAMIDGSSLFNNPAVDPVKVIAQTQQVTTRTIQGRLKTNLGMTAKEITRFLRFKKLIAQLVEEYPTPPDWAGLVFTHGYHDQSHLIKDFHQFMDIAPGEFIRQLAGQNVCISKPGVHY